MRNTHWSATQEKIARELEENPSPLTSKDKAQICLRAMLFHGRMTESDAFIFSELLRGIDGRIDELLPKLALDEDDCDDVALVLVMAQIVGILYELAK